MDAYLSILLDHPPSIRYFELSIPLPKLTGLWDATSDEERIRLQWSTPAGRERALFCNIIRDALEEDGQHRRRRCFPLTKLDYHLGLCALQGGVWEAAGEAHSFATDELSVKPGPGNAIIVWASHIDYWKRTMETSCRLSQQYLSSPLLAAAGSSPEAETDDQTDDEAEAACSDDRFSPYTLLLWHMAALKMHAPIPILQASASLQRLSPAPVSLRNYDLGARIRAWMKTPCARKSCWYSAQISRVVNREAAAAAAATADTATVTPAQALRARARQLLLSPLANHSMFLAAIVASSYAFYATSCSVCGMLELHPEMTATAAAAAAAAAATPVVDLYMADEDDAGLQAWFQAETGHSVWGPEQIPMCRCSFDGLTAWLREALAGDRTLELAFVAYTEKLRSG
ncbi:hypothetical protein CMQ_5974 [Grosmannia clavigera kw1407]|uniref:Uncharacterized protein n=1 Tax=Grosmannia clavigera (strain kw1407 / UAMH 11150) TaxID=655863 RepID=F0XM55_GROCL|nr:uncharacterized protein CMQ_5974 [Grosmannia clavigera kw1407]EFX01032.1 hypothetical protein CMQ_5974 [Grosmannia clavigera kw1407]